MLRPTTDPAGAPRSNPSRVTRRRLLDGLVTGGAAALLTRGGPQGWPQLLAPAASAAALPTFRVGTLPFGTVQWEVQTIIAHGFDQAAGLRVVNVPLATNDAGRVAFLSGSVDAIVNDLLFAARLRADGKAIRFLPFSTKEGALMVAAASPIGAVADIRGRSIGVAGGPLDKSWLVLRAAALKEGLDLERDARPVYGAPPLLAAKLESGELDCALLYWSACARLAVKGYRQVVSVEQLADGLGAHGRIAFVGFLFNDDAPQPLLAGFAKAVRQADQLLAGDPDAWTPLRPLMGAADDRTFGALKAAFIDGIPHKARADEIRDASDFFAVIAKLGGPALVGKAASLPESVYVDQTIYG